MDDNLRVFYNEYEERMDRDLAEIAQRITERINEDVFLKAVVLFFIISFVLLAFLILFISVLLAVGCIFSLTYLCIKILSAITGGGNRN